MKHFRLVHQGLDVAPMLAELEAQPELWDEYPERRVAPGSPHREMTDIHVRARARDDLDAPNAYREPHWPVFYPSWRRLPSIQPVVWALMEMTKAVQLGNVLITRIPAGGRIHPHVDPGWAVNWFAAKFYVVLKGNPDCVNHCLDESVVMQAGEIWSFENRVTHSVENRGETERVSLIVTMRVE